MTTRAEFNAKKPKYALCADDVMTMLDGTRLYRIRTLRSFGLIMEGERGGYVQSEHNLAHDGYCWVADNAVVFENAHICGNAIAAEDSIVHGNARLSGNAQVTDDVVVWGDAHLAGNTRLNGSRPCFHTNSSPHAAPAETPKLRA